ncbi:hypothetical protein O5O45_05565 [Hahella aquimaris]|uniref:hypothetical protein n=1 Tax=Hahella sp. HNIBRBA332 TaxID=3015983 RepID=UPI00273AEFC8|nr:hypothetical protein [Hahella sp. HNIBRBA332]WLQ15387.1 hypothetical protein O5O45_05565 [Hahella sp. HNIBRBA332]
MNSNLHIWEAVDKTAPEYTEAYTLPSGFVGTSVNASYLIKRATEQFGPLGTGWGYEILEERIDEGAPLNLDAEGQQMIMGKTHTIKLRFWYAYENEIAEFIHYGHTPYVYRDAFGIQYDSDAPKKTLTDAIKKCLYMLGFAGDVTTGMHKRLPNDPGPNHSAERKRQEAADKAWLDDQARLIEEAETLSDLEALYKGAAIRLKSRWDDAGLRRLTILYAAKKNTLEHAEPA